MFNYDDFLSKQLKCKCYRCNKDIKDINQYWDFYSAMFVITIKCHDKEQVVKLSERQIEISNKSGWFWAFMDRI